MIRIALTGSIGMGKSTIASMFAAAGVPVFDADAVVRRLQSEDSDLIAAIEARFPGVVEDGRLNRDALALRVLAKKNELRALEAIVHPAVQLSRQRFVAQHAGADALLFEIPLLFETGGADQYDKVVVASAPADVQRGRVLARPGMTEAKLAAILARQTSDADKRQRADFVIDTGRDLSTTERQVRDILSCLGLAGQE
jgi:dephospho-CoA kinase